LTFLPTVPERQSRKKPAPPRRRRPPVFWWILTNTLAACFVALSWVGCLYLFNQPEIPRNYELLLKIGRIEPLKEVTALTAPNGSSADPQTLYRRYFNLDAAKVAALNKKLLRNYMANSRKTLLNTYITGEYRVLAVRPLVPGEFFAPGFMVRARAFVQTDEFRSPGPYPVVIDYLFPTTDLTAAGRFRPGDVLEISKIPNCAAVIHATRTGESHEPLIHVTVAPIAYGSYQTPGGKTFSIQPPARLFPGTRFPLPEESPAAPAPPPTPKSPRP
jgi:hypothetical protein